jgi:hypothetical protein
MNYNNNVHYVSKFFIGLILIQTFLQSCSHDKYNMADFEEASKNSKLVNEGYNRCIDYVNAWMNFADPATGLIPRNISDSKDYWNAWDAAADNYPFMVLTSSIVMPDFFHGTALKMLDAEEKITSRIGTLPDTYSFSKKDFRNEKADTSQIIFGSAEYMKDGLIPLTEWLGESQWSNRMLSILNDLPGLGKVITELKGSYFGGSAVVEVNGDLLQVLSRMYWFTGERKYLEWAVEIADYYLNDNHLPTLELEKLRIRDHGCEIISGLCEAYLAASVAWPEKRAQWRPYVHKMLDRILEIGRNKDGLFYNEVNPVTGEILSAGISDTFGYTLDAYYVVYKLDSVPKYREAVVKALKALNPGYLDFDWENGSSDGYADAIEGTLNLYNREPLYSVKEWLDSQIRVMWNFQKPDGIIEGWHGDGNFARTTIMYCLWKSQGLITDRWNKDLNLGATFDNNVLYIVVSCKSGWNGKIVFDTPRWRNKMHMPFDYPRINQFPQWFTIESANNYEIVFYPGGDKKSYTGQDLINGLQVLIKPGEVKSFKLKQI